MKMQGLIIVGAIIVGAYFLFMRKPASVGAPVSQGNMFPPNPFTHDYSGIGNPIPAIFPGGDTPSFVGPPIQGQFGHDMKPGNLPVYLGPPLSGGGYTNPTFLGGQLGIDAQPINPNLMAVQPIPFLPLGI